MNDRKPVDFDQLYPGRFIKAGQLGKPATLTIKSVGLEVLEGDNGEEQKAAIGFEETPKAMILNKTNGICLRELFGRKVQEWVGKRITIFASEWNGDPCIRIYGTPEIDADQVVEIKHPRKRPQQMTMHATGKVEAAE